MAEFVLFPFDPAIHAHQLQPTGKVSIETGKESSKQNLNNVLREPNVGYVVGDEENNSDNSAVDPRGVLVAITGNHNTS